VKRARQAAWIVALHALEALAIIAAGVAIVAGLVFWRLSQGPISLDVMRDELQGALADALNGDVVSIGEAQASWRGSDRSLGIVLTDVSVAEAGGELIARAPRIAVDLSLSALLRGDVAFSRLVAEGGEASVVRNADGALAAGLGGPDRIARRAAAQGPDARRGLGGLRQALEALDAPGSMARDLRELRLEGATLYVRDALTGVDWRADRATLRVTRDASGVRAEAGGAIQTAGGRATELRLTARAGQSLRRAIVEVSLRNAVPSELFPADGDLGVLSRVELPISATASAAIDDAQGLLGADLDVTVQAGRLRILDRDIVVERAHVQAAYDPLNDTLTVNDADIASDRLSGRLRGRLDRVGELLSGGREGPFDLAVSATDVRLDVRPRFQVPLEAASIGYEGALYPSELRAAFSTLTVQTRGLSAHFTGEAQLERVSDGRMLPSVKISGPIDGEASLKDVLDFWPIDLAEGARDWLAQAVHGGRAFDVNLDLDFPAEAVVAKMLDDDRLTMTFGFADGSVTFVTGMSPLANARGAAVLRGNSFMLDMEDGQMAGLDFESGFVDIPLFHPKGEDARFGGVVNGSVTTLLTWLDEPPLEFPSEYGIKPSSIGGAGRVGFAITRAMLGHVPVEDIGYEVTGEFQGVSAPTVLPNLRLTDAAVTLTANNDELVAHGEGKLGPAPAVMEWREDFGDAAALSTRFHVETTLDAAAFDVFGAPVRRFFTGSTAVVIDAIGRGLDIAEADVSADLTSAELSLPDGGWSKPVGEPGAAKLVFGRGEDGGLEVSEATLTAPGADIAGGLALARDGRLLRLHLDHLMIEDLVDARGVVTRGSDGGLIVDAAGSYADVRSIVAQLGRGGGGDLGAPLRLDIQLDRATARDGLDLMDVRLALDHDGSRTRRLSFEAQGETGPLSALIEPAASVGGPRRFTLEAADAGEALYAFFGVNSVRGGTLSARADLPALDAPDDAPISAVVEAHDFVLASAPALAQILTIGSLEGLANTLAGEGIRFSHLDAPLTLTDGKITLDEAQAAGQALGVTVSGDIDLENETFDLEGVLVPAYGVNSVLGGIPVIGDIFVSRRGEGVFGLTYSIEGPFAQTRVFVNPLSALAPGFLRRLFEPVVPAETAPAAPGAPAAPPTEPVPTPPETAEEPAPAPADDR
jgi:hypothetical protein